MKYSIITFGCRVNQADSLRIEEALRARGGIDAPASDADLVVVNTCSVTASADQGARQTIRRIARDNPAVRVVVTGCYATRCESDVARAAERRPRRAQRRQGTPGRRRVRGCRAPCRRTLRTATVRAAPRSSPGSPGGRRSRCACRPAARSVRLLHHPDYARRRPERADRRRGPRGRRGSRRPDSRRSPSPACTSARSAAISSRAARSSICCARSTTARPTSSFASARSSRWTARRRSSISWRRAAAGSRRISTCRCSTPAIGCSALMRRPYTLDDYRAARRRDCRAPAACVDRLRHDRGFSRRVGRRLPGEPRLPAGVAADAPARVPVLRSAGHGGDRHAREGGGDHDPRARPPVAGDRRGARAQVPPVAGRNAPGRASRSRTAASSSRTII